jgi:Mg-chelatase subunit ChlD
MKLLTGILGIGALVVLVVGHPAPLFAQAAGNTAGTKENLDLPYDAIGEDDLDEDNPEVIQFYGQSYEGHGIFYTIDRSGSMQDSGELAIAKREVARNVSEFSNRVQFGIIFFARDIQKFPSSGTPAEANPSQKQSGIGWVQGMAGGSGSCCQQGIMQALQMANKASVKTCTIIYVGDGGGTCGGDENTYLNQTLSAVKGQNYKRHQVNAVGVLMQGRPQMNKDFCRQLAQMNGGRYTEVR